MGTSVYFRQLLAGRDYAQHDPLAVSMRNFTYALGDRTTREAILVDPAYAPQELIDILDADDMRVTGVVATHYHPDHVGGELSSGVHIDGVAELLALCRVPVHVHRDEVPWMIERAGVNRDALVAHDDRDVLRVGTLEVGVLHTPGHTPGSQCLVVENRLLSGDTLFIDGCGRTDFPGGDSHEMYVTMSQRLAPIGDEMVVYPGHLYSPESSLSMGALRRRNVVLHPTTHEHWLAMFGA